MKYLGIITDNKDLVTKEYVDNAVAGGGGGGLTKQEVIDLIYPVGSLYISFNSTDPSTLFGGTWEQIKDKFLLAAGDSYTAGTTGGSADAVVVSHKHTMPTFRQKSGGVASGSTYKWIHYDTAGGGGIGTSTNGEDGTGKNMPPYLAVYMWKRTA